MRHLAPALLILTSLMTGTAAHAQYMYMDANSNGVHDAGDVMNPNGEPTTVDVYLTTDRNRDGSVALCDVDPSVPLTINSYVVTLEAAGGTVIYSGYINQVAEYFIAVGEHNTDGIHYQNGRAGGVKEPGHYRLCTMTITGQTGLPEIRIIPYFFPASVNPTSFGTQCLGLDFDNTYKLGTDWQDADGLAAPCGSGCAPFLAPILNMALDEGTTAAQVITASDPDGDPISFQKVLGPPYMTVATVDPGTGTGSGEITLSPGFADAGDGVLASVRVTDGFLVGNTRSFAITVRNVNRPPVADPGGPYAGVPLVPLAFDGSGSSDPDGQTLGYSWNFGDLRSAVGPTPAHTYSTAGTYAVVLTVTDGSLNATASSTAVITDLFSARAFTTRANRIIRLGSGKPYWSVQLEPVGRAYDNAQVNRASIRMISEGTGSVSQIFASDTKTIVGSDADGNGVEEITASFSKDALQSLFQNLHGQNTVPVTFEGDLVAGGMFRATADVGVLATGGGLTASIDPNPLNPSGTLTVLTKKTGSVTVNLFDVHGRLVRILYSPQITSGGFREIPIDGKDEQGASLATGIYYFRAITADGTVTGRFAIMK